MDNEFRYGNPCVEKLLTHKCTNELINKVTEDGVSLVTDLAKENVAAREKKVETTAKLVWKAPKLFTVRTKHYTPLIYFAFEYNHRIYDATTDVHS